MVQRKSRKNPFTRYFHGLWPWVFRWSTVNTPLSSTSCPRGQVFILLGLNLWNLLTSNSVVSICYDGHVITNRATECSLPIPFTVELYFEELNDQLASAMDDQEIFITHAMFIPLFCREVSRQLIIDRGFKYRNILDLFTGKAQQIL